MKLSHLQYKLHVSFDTFSDTQNIPKYKRKLVHDTYLCYWNNVLYNMAIKYFYSKPVLPVQYIILTMCKTIVSTIISLQNVTEGNLSLHFPATITDPEACNPRRTGTLYRALYLKDESPSDPALCPPSTLGRSPPPIRPTTHAGSTSE